MKVVRFIDETGSVSYGMDRCGQAVMEVVEKPSGGFAATGRQKIIKRILPPVVPAAIFCIGLNYKGHAEETGMALPGYPVVFMKSPSSVIGHNDNIVIPEICKEKPQVDYEAELAIVIGRPAKNVKAGNALEYVKGYTIGNDISARWWQKHAGGGQWVRGKSFDTFCPLGPELITCDDIPDPGNLEISLALNGQVMQRSNTSDMIFPVSQIIAYLSQDTTLFTDTVILTGTPEGVGYARKPPVFLKPGDIVETTIDKIGTLINRVV